MTQLSLTSQLVEVLQNFAAINPNFVFDSDKPLGTISPTKAIVAQYSGDSDIFPESFSSYGIYDLNEFITAIGLAGDNAALDFSEKSAVITGQQGSVEYFFSRRDALNVSVVSINMPSNDVKFTISNDQIAQLKRASSLFGHKKVQFSMVNSSIVARVCDPSNPTAPSFSLSIETDASEWNDSFVIDIDNMKFMKGDYSLTYSSKGITLFENTTMPIRYWIAVEK